MSIEGRLLEAGALVDRVRDVIEGRVVEPAPPAWCEARGWSRFLLTLSDEKLRECEAAGVGVGLSPLAELPADLRELMSDIDQVIDLPWRESRPPRPLPSASVRKSGQVAALVQLCRERLGACRRVVDVGAGRGHLTRELAEALGVPSVGLERRPDRVAAATALTDPAGPSFQARDITLDDLRFEPGDLAVGLHACGTLGDTLVLAAARDQVDLLLVNCCLQVGQPAQRTPLSAAGRTAKLVFSRGVLGLTNLIGGRRLVEDDPQKVMEHRTWRHALRLLLRARGLDLPAGEEMRGLGRRHVRRGLAALCTEALARRGLPAATAAELTEVEGRAEQEFGRIRRLSLPRALLGRLLEVAVVLDRARCLEEAEHQVLVANMFDLDLSPRNLGIVART